MSDWPVQRAKSQFSQLLEAAAMAGPQTITRHGKERAVVLSAEDYRRLTGGVAPKKTFIQHLLSGPKFDDFELPPREIDPPRDLNLWDEEEDEGEDGESVA